MQLRNFSAASTQDLFRNAASASEKIAHPAFCFPSASSSRQTSSWTTIALVFPFSRKPPSSLDRRPSSRSITSSDTMRRVPRCLFSPSENAFKIGPYIRQIEEQGKRVIKCNLGEPDFPVPQPIKEEVKRQIDRDNTHYCDPQGILPLRQAVAKHFRETRGIPATPDRVVVFPGAKPPIGFGQQTYCDPGDEVVYPSPGFPIYESFIHYVGATPVPLHLDEAQGFSFAGPEIAPLLSPRTKLIYLCFPSNPTGGVASKAQLQEIADVIRTRCGPDVRVYADEVYEDILFDGSVHHSIISVPGIAERTVLVSGASKSYS